MFYAHRREDGELQPLLEHLQETARRSGKFGEPFGAEKLAYLTGLAHDLGKYSQEFQKRLLKNGPVIDHSTAGARERNALYHNPSVAYPIAGHHGGLPDGGRTADTVGKPLIERLTGLLPDYGAYREELRLDDAKIPPLPLSPLPNGGYGFTLSFFIRMLFSCLVDADFLDTERFMQNSAVRRGGYDDPAALLSRLKEYIRPWGNPEEGSLNEKRCAILRACLDAGKRPKGLYTLTVPTGGGKTVSSLAFALTHAVEHQMPRVIYVVPYTSIIDQNAAVFRRIVGDGNVLEHHANVSYDSDEGKPSTEQVRKRLSTENWDAPLIVTTTVQFFESLFASKTSRCRKLHNIAGSVLVFDEAQMLPLPYLLPCVRAVAELIRNYGCTAVLCTATQPALQPYFPADMPAQELCPDPAGMYATFRRTALRTLGRVDDEGLAARLAGHRQALCIVNSRRQARSLYDGLPEEGRFYLTTILCPWDRIRILYQIKYRLKKGLPCRVAATSLVEAGVDLDFPAVYRARAGLDSILQAAGRCNREGKRPEVERSVFIFDPEEQYTGRYWATLRQAIQLEQAVDGEFADLASLEAVEAYFHALHQLKGEQLDEKQVIRRFDDGFKPPQSQLYPFASVAKNLHLIEDNTYPIVIPRNKRAEKLIARLTDGERSRGLLRQIAPYTVSVYPNQRDALLKAQVLRPLDEALYLLTDPAAYSPETGLAMDMEPGVGVFV